jgi:hypothetical protein
VETLAFKQTDALKDKLAEENLSRGRNCSEFNFEEIVGDSSHAQARLAQVELVAPAGTAASLPAKPARAKSHRARHSQSQPAPPTNVCQNKLRRYSRRAST